MSAIATIHVSPYRLIKAAGFDISIKNHTRKYRVQLIRGAEIVAFADCPRTGNLSSARALEKARNGTWGPTSAFYGVLTRFAQIAEAA